MNLTLNDITIIRGNIKKFLLMQENYEKLNAKNNIALQNDTQKQVQRHQRPPVRGTVTGPTMVHDRFSSTNTSLMKKRQRQRPEPGYI